MLTRDQILAVKDITTKTVNVPEWGGEVTLRGLTAAERDNFDTAVLDARRRNEPTFARARLVALSAVDEKGDRLFKDSDIPALSDKAGSALDRLFDVAAGLSGLRAADQKEMEKN